LTTFQLNSKSPHLAVSLALALLLGGCASATKVDPTPTGAIATPNTSADFENSVTYWAGRYSEDETDRSTALGYAQALQQTGRSEQAVAVLQKAAIRFPEDREVLSSYGKALAANGNLNRALSTVERAQTPDQPDWRLLSAEAAILDQLGRHGDARQRYMQAVDLAPNEPSILSNYGMSYLLTGDLKEAERLLRKAVAMGGADSRVRQNLALAVGLSGRFEEAEEIAGAELPPVEAAANIAYLRQVLGERNNWKQLAEGS
jgi:Flp pilus assembly protein TadD